MPERSADVEQLLGGKYRLEQVLGSGGMGCVYAARHQTTGRSVAIKRIHPALLSRRDLVRRVSREARLAVEAAHPNVVEVLDAGADANGVPYLVLERLYGQGLDAWMGKCLSLRATAQVLVPVANALVHLHQAGIVHRDLKPSNIFLAVRADGRMTPKLLDFGLAKALEDDAGTRSGVALGTPAYMAPEQALGCGLVGPATDVWSFAVVFAQCLTGELPFGLRSLASLRSGLSLEDLAGMPAAIASLLARALSFDPLARPADMRAFRGELSAALACVDPELAWPDAATVGYARDEIELELRTVPRRMSGDEAHTDVASDVVRARPLHLTTRTLPSLLGSAAVRWPRRLVRTALSLLVATVAVFAWYAARGQPTPAPSASKSDRPRAAAQQGALKPEIGPAPERIEPIVPATVPAPGVSAERTRQRAANAAFAPASAPAQIVPDEPHSPAPSPIGANRAPIIE